MKKYLEELNENQYKAATTLDGPVLLLAGAGTGKTKTIISRTVNLIDSRGVPPESILVMTFTNKAAKEMSERGQKLLGEDNVMPDFTTFHSWGARMLRVLSDEQLKFLNYNRNFTILDTPEQVFILDKIKMRIFEESIAKKIKMKKFLLTLGSIQNHLTRFDSIENTIEDLIEIEHELDLSMFDKISITDLAKLFVEYKRELILNNVMDFEDLINLPIKILDSSNELRNYFSNRYQYMMIDEFQDTNNSQLKLLFLLLNDNNNICVVGDDSQSIYGWRGADIKHILFFNEYFKEGECTIINLDTNYRSTETIISKANVLLKSAVEIHNAKKPLKHFISLSGQVSKKMFDSSTEEANNIAAKIKRVQMNGGKNFAILYRSAIVSKKMELALISYGIHYTIHNGKTILERKTAQSIISYLKFINNKDNNLALSNVLVNSGTLTENKVLSYMHAAHEEGNTFLSFLKDGSYKSMPRTSNKIIEKVEIFLEELDFLNGFEDDFEKFKGVFFNHNVIKSKFLDMMLMTNQKEEKIDEAKSNLNLISLIEELSLKYNSLQQFLDVLALDGEDRDLDEDKVNLMTVHASKGLEFDNVFVMGAVDGIFPSDRSIENGFIEEERRLFYVAITRAKYNLTLSGAKYYYGENKDLDFSRFIKEAQI